LVELRLRTSRAIDRTDGSVEAAENIGRAPCSIEIGVRQFDLCVKQTCCRHREVGKALDLEGGEYEVAMKAGDRVDGLGLVGEGGREPNGSAPIVAVENVTCRLPGSAQWQRDRVELRQGSVSPVPRPGRHSVEKQLLGAALRKRY
jgi:hypothetical protein